MSEKEVKIANEQAALEAAESKAVAATNEPYRPMGFEDEEEGDVIIPRIKVIQDLSPERKEKIADSGDLLNSLTHEKIEGKRFIPVYKYANNIEWLPRADGGGIRCRSLDGKTGHCNDGTSKLCAVCRRNEFDNTKTGKESEPLCTKYINFLGFLEGERVPLVLSFCKTYYNEGKKMYSLAKFSMKDMWATGYMLKAVEKSKNGNDWFIITASAAGATTKEDQDFGYELYKMFKGRELKVDLEQTAGEDTSNTSSMEVDEDIANEI
jgi:hypothetical protein